MAKGMGLGMDFEGFQWWVKILKQSVWAWFGIGVWVAWICGMVVVICVDWVSIHWMGGGRLMVTCLGWNGRVLDEWE